MANALATRDDINLEELQRTASMLVASGYFTDKGERNTQVAQLATKIMAGRELGYGPFASVQGIHVIQGKPQISANLMAAAVKSHPRYDYKVRKMEADAVSIEFFENGESIGVSTFTKDDATKAGTQNLNKFPRNMLFARALSNGVRWFAPDVFHGQAVYVEGEIEEAANERPAMIVVDRATGEIIEGEYSEAPPTTNGHTNGNGLTWNELANLYDKEFGVGKARTQSMDNVREWAESRGDMFVTRADGSIVLKSATNGNGHKPTDAPADDVDMASNVQLKRINALGTQLYRKEWNDDKRHDLVAWKTKERTRSSRELTAVEADSLITGLQKKINEAAAAVQTPPQDEPVDEPFAETEPA